MVRVFPVIWACCLAWTQARELNATQVLSKAQEALHRAEYTECAALLVQAEKLLEAAPAAENAFTLCRLKGHLHMALGQYMTAAMDFKNAAQTLAKWKDQDTRKQKWYRAIVRGENAVALFRAGQPQHLDLFEQSLAGLADVPESWAQTKAILQHDYATALLDAEKLPEAAQLAETCAATFRKNQDPALIASLNTLGAARHRSGKLDAAKEAWEEAWEAAKALPEHHPLRGIVATHLWSVLSELNSDTAATYAAASARTVAAIFARICQGKSEAQHAGMRERFDLHSVWLSPALRSTPGWKDSAADFLLNSQDALLELQRAGTRSPQANRNVSILPWRTFQQEIPSDAALVSYFIGEVHRGQGRWAQGIGVIVLRSSGEPLFSGVLCLMEEILPPLDRLQDALNPSVQPPVPEAEVTALLDRLTALLWRPLVDGGLLGQNPRRIFLCADGRLAAVPWAMLRHGTQSTPLLESSVRLEFLAGPRALSRGAARAHPLPSGTWLGIDAGEVFAVPSNAAYFPFHHARAVSVAATTLKEFAEISAAAPEGKIKLLRGADAREAALGKALAEKPVLWHFAGHGFGEATGAANLWADAGRTPAWFSTCLAFPNYRGLPNHDAPPLSVEDDCLYAAEIARLDLSATPLVTLSACRTGLAPALRGEGQFDLARACHVAGARDVLVSIGFLEDATVPRMMAELFPRLAKGMDPAEAAWEAQRSLWLAVGKSSGPLAAWRAAGPYKLLRN